MIFSFHKPVFSSQNRKDIKCTSKGHILVQFEFDGCTSAELYQNAKNCLQIIDYTIIYFST